MNTQHAIVDNDILRAMGAFYASGRSDGGAYARAALAASHRPADVSDRTAPPQAPRIRTAPLAIRSSGVDPFFGPFDASEPVAEGDAEAAHDGDSAGDIGVPHGGSAPAAIAVEPGAPVASGGGDIRRRSRRGFNGAPAYPQEFDEFWSIYPRIVNKVQAFRSWQRVDPRDRALVIFATGKHAQAMLGRETDKIPHAATWLNQLRYEDCRPDFDAMQNGVTAEPAIKAEPENLSPEPVEFGAWLLWMQTRLATLRVTKDELLDPSKRMPGREPAYRQVWRMQLIRWLVNGFWPRDMPKPHQIGGGNRGYPPMTMAAVAIARTHGRLTRQGDEASLEEATTVLGDEMLAYATQRLSA